MPESEEVKFLALVEGVVPSELSEMMLFIDRLAMRPAWKRPRVLDWDMVEKVEKG